MFAAHMGSQRIVYAAHMGAAAALYLRLVLLGAAFTLIVFFAPGGLAGRLAAKTSTTGIEEG